MHYALMKLSKKIISAEEEHQKMRKYMQMMDHDGWKTQFEWLNYLRGVIAEDLLSDRFARLTADEKDVLQRAYNFSDQLILFLLDPTQGPRKVVETLKHNRAVEQAMSQQRKKK